MDSLSDYELRKMLVEYGVHNGPVTPTTRNVLQNKLSRVMSQRHGFSDGEVRVESQTNGYSESYVVQESTTEYAVREPSTKSYAVEESSTETYAVEEALDTSAAADDFPEAGSVHQEVESHLPASKSTTTSYEYRSTPKSTLRYARDSYPSANDLRRRPLNTPVIERSTKSTVEKTHSESVTTALPAPKTKANKSRWYCSVVFLVLLLILVCFVVVVYYHMEHDEMRLIPTAAPTVVPNTEHQKGDEPPKV